MTQQIDELHTARLASLLTGYGFDLRGVSIQQLLHRWLANFSPQWIYWALVEALYQGRYKAVSVEHLLKCWGQRGQPCFHFNHDFEQFISHTLPRNLPELSTAVPKLTLPHELKDTAPTTLSISLPEEKPKVRSIDQFQPVLTQSRLLSKLQTVIY